MSGQIDQLLVSPLIATEKMPLDFNEHIVAPESANQKLRPIGQTPGSALLALSFSRMGVSPAGDDVSSSRTFGRLFRRDIETSTRDACATRMFIRDAIFSKQRDQTFGKGRQFAPLHRALSLFAAQMRLCQKLAQIFVIGSVLDQQRKNAAIFHA